MTTTEHFQIITLTHRHVNLPDLAPFMVDATEEVSVLDRLKFLKKKFGLSELLYLQTCNRVTYIFCTKDLLDQQTIGYFLTGVNPLITPTQIQLFKEKGLLLSGRKALNHLFEVACSIDSLVIGEREILHQLRTAFDTCQAWGLTGDKIKMAIQAAVETSKEVFAKTRIGEKPLSVVSLAMHQIKQLKLASKSRYLLVGAGQTIRLVAKLLAKQEYGSVAVFNRTISKAQSVAEMLEGEAYTLSDLPNYNKGFDVMIVCTGANHAIIDPHLYQHLLQDEQGQKVVVDLAIPNNVAEEVTQQFPMHYIQVDGLRELAKANFAFRSQEAQKVKNLIARRIDHFEAVYAQRLIIRRIQEIPRRIKAVREEVQEKVFKKELEALPPTERKVVDQLLRFMEKRYISVPITMAKGLVEVPIRHRR